MDKGYQFGVAEAVHIPERELKVPAQGEKRNEYADEYGYYGGNSYPVNIAKYPYPGKIACYIGRKHDQYLDKINPGLMNYIKC